MGRIMFLIAALTLITAGTSAHDFNMEIVQGQRRSVKIVSAADSLTGDTLVIPEKETDKV